MTNAPDLSTLPICSLARSWQSKMILRRKSVSRLCKKNDSIESCPRKKIKPKMYSKGKKHKSLEIKQKTPHLDNSISFRPSPINLITSTPLQKSLTPGYNGRRNLKNSNLVTTIKKKSTNRNISSPTPSSATPKSVNGSRMRITRSMTTSSKDKLSANNLPIYESLFNTCQVQYKKISFNVDDSGVNETGSNSRKLSLRSSSRIKPSLLLSSTPISSNSEKRGRPNSRTKLKKADKDSNYSITSLHSQNNSDLSYSSNMVLRSVDSYKKESKVAGCVEQSSVINRDKTPCNNRNALWSKSKEQRLKNKQILNGDNAHQYFTPVVKKGENTQHKRRPKARQTYSPSFVKRHETCLTFCGQIPVDDLCLTLKHNTRKAQSDIIPVKEPCLTSKRNALKVQSNIDIPVDSLCTTSRRSTRKVQSDSKYKGPGKNTLKRKRAVIEAMKKADESYEDDLYEGKEFNHFKDLFIDSCESDVSFSMPTPKFGFQLTPVVRQKTPKIADCFSPRAFALSRKMAEEYIYRRNKMRKCASVSTKSVTPLNNGEKKRTFNQVISDVAKVQDAIEKLRNDESDVDDDSNLSF